MKTFRFGLAAVGSLRGALIALAVVLFGGSFVRAHEEIPGMGTQNFTRTVEAKDGKYRVDVMYSPSLPTAGEEASIGIILKRLLATPNPLLGSEVAVPEVPGLSLLAQDTKKVVVERLPVQSEGEAGDFEVAGFSYPKAGSFLLHLTVRAQSGETLAVDFPVTVQANPSVFFRLWVNIALVLLIVGLTATRLSKVRARGGAGSEMARPAIVGLVCLVAVIFVMDRFVIGAVLDLRKPKVAEAPEAAVTSNEDGSYTIPAAVQQQQGMSTVTAKPVALRQTVMSYGTVEARPDLTAVVQAPLWGRIEFSKGPLAVGDAVKAGQGLVEIVLELNALERGLLDQKDVDLKGALARARQRRDAARLEFSRAQALRAKDPAYEPDVVWAKQLFDEATAQFAEITKQEQGYQSTMKLRDPRRVPVASPMNGVITTIDFVPGELNETDTYRKLFTIVDTTHLWVKAQVYLSDVVKLKDGETVHVFPESGSGQPVAGRIRWIGETIDPVNRTASVLIDVPNEGRTFALGSFARVEFEQRRDVLAVPEYAVVDEGVARWVYVARKEGTFVPVAVEMGAKHDGWWEVRSGLMEGDVVVAKGAAILGSMPKPEEHAAQDASPAPTAELAPAAEGAKP